MAAGKANGGHEVFGTPFVTPGPWPPRDIPGEEALTLGTRFDMSHSGEITLVELLPGTPASYALHPPQVGDQLFKVNGKLLPALIDRPKLTLLLAQQCYEADSISLSFRTAMLDEYTTVVHLIKDHSPQKPAGHADAPFGVCKPETSPSHSQGDTALSFAGQSPGREAPAYLPVGLTPKDSRWHSFGSPGGYLGEPSDHSRSLTEFLDEMRLELQKVKELAEKKVKEADEQRMSAEEDLEVLQEQTFSRVQLMQEQITLLRSENLSLRAEVQQLNLTVRTRNMGPVCPSCSQAIVQNAQKDAAVAIDRVRSLLQGDSLNVYRQPALSNTNKSSGAPSFARSPGSTGDGQRGFAGAQGEPSGNGQSGGRASVMMEDGSELPVDPRTGRVLTASEHDALELL